MQDDCYLIQLFVFVVLLFEQFLFLLGSQRPHGHAQEVIIIGIFRVLLSIAVGIRIVTNGALFLFLGLENQIKMQ